MNAMGSHLEIAIASVKCFSDDGTLDEGELNFLLGLALRDNKVDDDEKRVLGNIFNEVSENTVKPAVWERIQEVRKKYQIP